MALNLSTVDAQRILPVWASPSLPVVFLLPPFPYPPLLVGQKTKAGDIRMALGAV